MMQTIIITNPTEIEGEKELIKALIRFTDVTIHFRKPDFSNDEAIHYLPEFSANERKRIVSHNYPEIVDELGLKGIHFTGNTKHRISQFDNYSGSKSTSAHSYQEIENAEIDFNYYFLSPIYQSISKQGYGGDRFDFDELRKFLSDNSHKEIIALGGVHLNKLKQIKELGFSGIALLGSVWNLFEQTQSVDAVLSYLQSIKNILA